MWAPPRQVAADFDRIAVLPDNGWDHNAHYHPFLLRHAPAHCRAALDVGAGTGAFSRLLAGRSDRVLGIDLSPEMVRIARERSRGLDHVEFRTADVMDEPLPIAGFDCIVTIAMLHHLPLIPALERLSTLLAPGGVLLVLDLYRPRQLRDALWQAVAVPTSIALNLTRCGRIRPSAEHRAAWAEHGRRDLYPTIAEVGRAALLCLPGAQLKRHLLWRYSLVWRKSDDWPATAEALGTHPTRMQP